MIWSHVTLPTRCGKASNADRTRVPSVTDSTGPDRAVAVRLSHTVALITSAGFGQGSFQFSQWIGRTTSAARLILFRKTHLLGCEALLAVDRSPGGRGVATVEELLINVFVAAPAVPRRQLVGDDESVVVLLLLALGRLMAIEAVHALARVRAHLVFMDYGILRARMAFGAFSGCPNQLCARFFCLYFWASSVNQKRSHDQSESNHHSDEYRAKRHWKPPRKSEDGFRSLADQLEVLPVQGGRLSKVVCEAR